MRSTAASSCARLLRRPQDRAAAARAGRQGRVDHRPAPRAVGDAQRRRRSRSSTPCTACRSSIRWPTGATTTSGHYMRDHDVPYNALHDRGYPSIGCAPCTRADRSRARTSAPGRWWWEARRAQGMRPASRARLDIAATRSQPRKRHDMTHAMLRASRASARGAVAAVAPADADHLDWLEAEAIHILREVAGQCRNPALLFSGGKDSLVLLRLAEKAFRPGRVSVPAAAHRHRAQLSRSDRVPRPARARELGERLIVRSRRRFDRARGTRACCADPTRARNPHQSVTLLEAIAEFGFDACIGGARRDEEKARAKERIFSFRDEFGQWDPKNQRPELWNLYNARVHPGEHVRVFPISNWTELDVWQYIARERLARAVDLLRAHARRSCAAAARWCRSRDLTPPRDGETSSRTSRCAFAPSATSPARPGGVATRRRVDDDHRRDRGDARSPSAARRAWTTRPPTRRWSCARRKAISDVGDRHIRDVLDHGVLRFLTAGSVDDGKSTLIGRLLYDTKAILADQLAALERTSQRRGPGASTSRCSPTASRPSASRASRSTSRTATSPRRGASSSSPTRRATSSTRATW